MAFPPPCLALVQNSVQMSSENHKQSVRIESQGTFWGLTGALLGPLLAQRAKSIQNVSSLAALRGPSETPNLRKLGRRRPNASQNCVQNLTSESCSNKLVKSVKIVTLSWTLDVLKTLQIMVGFEFSRFQHHVPKGTSQRMQNGSENGIKMGPRS